jgi:tRNA-specific 2-thiouridylase
VTALEGSTNTVFVGPEAELLRRGLSTGPVNWVSIAEPSGPIRAAVRIRYQHREAPAEVTPRPDGSVSVRFDEPQRSIALGQWAVLYDGERLLGGGVIEGSW